MQCINQNIGGTYQRITCDHFGNIRTVKCIDEQLFICHTHNHSHLPVSQELIGAGDWLHYPYLMHPFFVTIMLNTFFLSAFLLVQ